MKNNLRTNKIEDCFTYNLKINRDSRGYFLNILSKTLLCDQIPLKKIKQINVSKNKKKGTIRGLHFQKKPYSEAKFIFCMKGQILDIVLDLRKKSETYGKYVTFKLSGNTPKILFVPKNCAHGYQTVTDDTIILYLHTNIYYPQYDTGINPLDQKLNIKWPIANKIISNKDKNLENFANNEV